MPPTPAGLLAMTRTTEGRKVVRYSVTSVVALIVSLIVLAITHGLLLWSAFISNIVATAVAAIPSYELNRRWAWGKTGKGHLWKEVVPFWALAFIGLAFSTWWAVLAESLAKHRGLSHAAQTALVELAVVMAYGILWVGKFIIFNKVLFAHHPEDLEPALDGRSGLPG
jgi:putative flippase GtrA